MAGVTKRHEIEEGLIVFKQANSNRFYARFKIDGEWYTKATGEKQLNKAKTKAAELRTEFKIMLSNNIPVHKTRRTKKHAFSTIADKAISRIQSSIDNGTALAIFPTYIQVLNKLHKPFFGDMNIRDVLQENTLTDFKNWTIKTLKKTPAKSTVNTYNTAFQRVLDEAVIHGLLTSSEIPKLENYGAKGKRRSAFSKAEYEQILDKFDNWIAEGRKKVTREIRKRLKYYIQVAALSGLRPGTEMEALTWNDITVKEIDKKSYTVITVRSGKTSEHTGTREVIAKSELRDIVEDMVLNLRTGNDWDYNDPVFGNTGEFGRNFSKVLNELNIKEDAHGERTLYSLRHSYITWELQKGRSVPVIAAQCGTSAEMIEKHYSHIVPSMFANQLAN